MKRLPILLLILALFLPAGALADSRWLIEDSNTRALTEAELWMWDYESLGYILHEIYARHGYRFDEGSAYAEYFTAQDWYTPNPRNNMDGCFTEMSDLEWENADLVQMVMLQMSAQGTVNSEKGASLWSDEVVIPPLDFKLAAFYSGQKFSVYSAPSTKAWRGANGKASVSTNGEVWCAGTIDGWMLVYYETNKGSIRVGYIDGSGASGDFSALSELTFAGTPARITEKTKLTDDPARNNSSIVTLKVDREVTYLAPYSSNGQDWAYIETTTDGDRVRGFVPADSLEILPE